MSGGIEAVYIFDQHNNPILEHVYYSRPLAARDILPLYLAHPEPRPPLIYLPNTNPPTLVFSLIHDQLLFISPASVDTEPLLVLEFLHRVVDVLEEFLGAPLLASKIEGAYDVVAQLFLEMCDAGTVCNTEPNALRDFVDVPGWVGKLLGGVGLPVSSPALGSSSGSLSLQRQHGLAPSSTSTPALPWRRSNVRHTSNEIYVDIVETLSVILAPSGRPLSAFANGSIACTAKVSGVPDLLLTLTAPGGKAGLDKTLELPVFHPCVRLARWREQPGVLSFVPPDGRFMLAGYEVDLLPNTTGKGMNSASSLHLPASVEMKTSLGLNGADFEARLLLSTNFPSSATAGSLGAGARGGGISSRLGNSSPAFGGSSNQPLLEAIVVTIPIPSSVRNLTDLRASRGEAHYSPGDKAVEWRVSAKEAVLPNGTGGATLRCTVVGPLSEDDDNDLDSGFRLTADTVDYNEDTYQTSSLANATDNAASSKQNEQRDLRRIQLNKTLMPSSAAVSFTVKGWLPSGIRVDSLVINTRTSKGLGEGVKPYKGVKYLTVSKQGVETRC
ncbi:clathrin adaptor, mu subunit [Xylona heveae TC161]|uniref:Clathrin adaptor, mu subunit n=1 Tax=Xylona heveae (strain CBS 132557 / TC161) TaxID=1328760 RepID=A0A164ZG26_XYLHT|nr:clathrin adaptor, mu subunit [Xylona heveae TC161]KZF19059.1 clathrin adaptor, mu subunit [Xylona heveae TC161]